MTSSKMLHIRVDDAIKTQATETLEAMGLSMSEAVRLFLHRVVSDQALPFELKVTKAKTLAAMNEVESIAKARRARFSNSSELLADIEKKRR
jgi:DNA-damage-inducible protein J